MKQFNIKVIKTNTFGLFNVATGKLLTWSSSPAALFRFLKTVTMENLLLNLKRSMIKGFSRNVMTFNNLINGGVTLTNMFSCCDVPHAGDCSFDKYKMIAVTNHYNAFTK